MEEGIRVFRSLPTKTSMWGYDHCPLLYNKSCPIWEDALFNGTVEAGLMKIISGVKTIKSGGKIIGMRFSRSPDSWISLDTFSLGFAHWWAETCVKLLSGLAKKHPDIAKHAWGDEIGIKMTNQDWLKSQIEAKRGKMPHNKKYDWLLSGWWEIGLHPTVMTYCIDYWIKNYTPDSISFGKNIGFFHVKSYAGLMRIANSRGTGGMKTLASKCIKENPDVKNELDLMKILFSEKYYDHPDRWDEIINTKEFNKKLKDITGGLQATRIVFNPDLAVRIDGTKPEWLKNRLFI